MPAGDETGPRGEGPQTGLGRGASLESRVGFFDELGGSIDSLVAGVKEIPKLAKKVAYYLYYTVKPTATLYLTSLIAGINPFIMGGGFALGTILSNMKNKVKTTYKQIANEITVGALMGAFVHHLFKGIGFLSNAVGLKYGRMASYGTTGALAFAQVPVFMTAHEYTNRTLISEYEAQPWDERKKETAKTTLSLGPLVAGNLMLLPEYLHVAGAALISTFYRFITGKKPKEEKAPTPAPQVPAGYAPQPAYQPR